MKRGGMVIDMAPPNSGVALAAIVGAARGWRQAFVLGGAGRCWWCRRACRRVCCVCSAGVERRDVAQHVAVRTEVYLVVPTTHSMAAPHSALRWV